MMTSPFHCDVRLTNSYHPPFHYGEDYVPKDKSIESNWTLYSPCSGRVVISKKQMGDYPNGFGAFGNYLVIESNGIWVLMAHLKNLPSVKVGEMVEEGQKVGIAGSTGNSTGRHLHIEVSDHPERNGNWWLNFRAKIAKPSSFIDFEYSGKDDFEVKEWKNGKTRELVYSTVDDCKLRENRIGSIDPYEKAECYGIIDGCYLVVYNTSNSKKTGFVRYSGGVK